MLYLYYGGTMNIILKVMISYNRNKLHRLIEKKVSYNKILQQSQKLDKLILKAMKQINKEIKS